MHLTQIRAAWADVVGLSLAEAAEPHWLHGGVLVVVAAHPVAAQEVSLRREAIVRDLRERIPQAQVRRVRVVVSVGKWRGRRGVS